MKKYFSLMSKFNNFEHFRIFLNILLISVSHLENKLERSLEGGGHFLSNREFSCT